MLNFEICIFFRRIVIEIPHFASLRGKEREIKIMRSNNGDKWEEHSIVASDDAVQKALSESMEGKHNGHSITVNAIMRDGIHNIKESPIGIIALADYREIYWPFNLKKKIYCDFITCIITYINEITTKTCMHTRYEKLVKW